MDVVSVKCLISVYDIFIAKPVMVFVADEAMS